MQDVGADAMHPAAVPNFLGIGENLRKAFVIAVNEKNGVRQSGQRIQLAFILLSESKDTAEVAGDNQCIIRCQSVLFVNCFKAGYLTMRITSNVEQADSPAFTIDSIPPFGAFVMVAVRP